MEGLKSKNENIKHFFFCTFYSRFLAYQRPKKRVKSSLESFLSGGLEIVCINA